MKNRSLQIEFRICRLRSFVWCAMFYKTPGIVENLCKVDLK